MSEHVVVQDADSLAAVHRLVNTELANRPMNVTAGPLLRARDALTWAIPTEAAEARGELALHDWWMAKGYTDMDDPDFADGVRHVIHGLRNVEPPTDDNERTS